MNSLTIHQVVQGGPEWHALRLGKLTASRADEVLTPARLGPSKGRHALACKLAHERITGSSAEDFKGNAWTEHGHNLEGEAAEWFELQTGLTPVLVGFIENPAYQGAGCSPDVWTADASAGIELKCPAGWTHIGWLREHALPTAHAMQVQFSLWLTGIQTWYFMSYPKAREDQPWRPGASLPPLLVRVEPDPRYQDALSEHVPAFLTEVEVLTESLVADGATMGGSDG